MRLLLHFLRLIETLSLDHHRGMVAIASELYKQILDSISDRFMIHEVSDQEQPVFITGAFPLEDGFTGLKPRLPSGRGLTLQHAKLGAAAETIELMCCLTGHSDENMARIKSKNGFDEIDGIEMATDVPRPIAAQSVFLDYAMSRGQPLHIDADTTGCAARVTFDDARQTALLECIERDAFAIWWYGRQSRGHINLTTLDQIAPRVSWWLTQRARQTFLIDICSDIGVPVIAAVSSNPDGSHVAIGSAAHGKREVAALHAVTEMIQTETSMRLAAHSGDLQLEKWLQEASTKTMPQFINCEPANEVLSNDFDVPLEAVTHAGFSAFAVDLTLARYPLAVARVLVPGFCALNRRYVLKRILQQAPYLKRESELETLEPF
jgi:ribosomal protein S12 methylthiotransferase accessory factor YcaO